MGRPRRTKAKAKANAKDEAPSSAPFSIGNCKVEIHGGGLTCRLTEQDLTISGPECAKIVVSVDGDRNSSNRTSEGQFRVSTGSDFILLNPNDSNSRNKTFLQEALILYKQELPAMDYAADTGKKSHFLEKCIINGKYKTLILSSSSAEGPEEVMAAVSYQIVPADTQYAEIPLAVVRSPFQRVGFGHLLYNELSQRLQNVGVTTILCWADKASEGFWLKQGFVSVGEVDTKGKACRIPVRADIRRALCFPGSSTLMVTHLKKDLPTSQKISLTELQTSQLHAVAPDCLSLGDTDKAVPSCENSVPQKFGCHNVSRTYSRKNKVNKTSSSGGCSSFDQQPNKRTYETSSSSLNSKRVRCSRHVDHNQEMNQDGICDKFVSISNTPEHQNLMHPMPEDLCNPSMVVHVESKTSRDANATIFSNGRPSIMLMNIADETKKTRLIEVVEMLGGFVTYEGSSCTHVVTGKARRTMNFCIALSLGAWIVSSNWLKQSFKQRKFVDETEYVLEDEDYKMKYNSQMRDAVMRAKERPCSLFSGYTFCLTKYIQPSVAILSPIVKSSGGKIIRKLGDLDETSKTIFLVCEEDMELALDAAKRGIKTFSSDWFMSCIMRQELDLEAPQFTESL